MPKLSILTPVWNGLPMVQTCIESVLSQKHEDWEYIISDNGSTDGTREYLATLKDPRVRVFCQPQNLGILGNVNFLTTQARAPVSQILCADDYFLDPGSVSRILEMWSQASSDTGFIRANWNRENANRGSGLEAYALKALPKLIEPRNSDLCFFLFGCLPGNLSNVSFRTHLVEESGWFDQRYPAVGDFEFWIRAARRASFRLEAVNVTHVRRHDGQATHYLNRSGEAVSQLYEIVETLFDRIKSDFPVRLLKLHATLGYDVFHRWSAVRVLLYYHKAAYLEELTVQSANRNMLLGGAMRWMAFLLSGGGRWGNTLAARYLLSHRTA